MIPELDKPVEALSEDVLAAAVLLRLYEERATRPGAAGKDATTTAAEAAVVDGVVVDMRTHLLGSSRMLASQATLRGGVAEACAWLVVRQDIFVSLTQSTPPCLPLESLMTSRSFVEEDPRSLANRIIFLCGRILDCVFRRSGGGTPDNGENVWWREIGADVDAWFRAKPWHFQPTWVDDGGGLGKSAFPTLWMAHPGYGEFI